MTAPWTIKPLQLLEKQEHTHIHAISNMHLIDTAVTIGLSPQRIKKEEQSMESITVSWDGGVGGESVGKGIIRAKHYLYE